MIESLPNIQAVILAGGKGTRLRSVVSDRPKVMAEVMGRPFICHLLDYLGDQGIRRVVLCTGYMAEMVENALGVSYRGIDILYSREDEPLDTAGAVRLAAPRIDSDPALVMNGDSFYRAALDMFAQSHTSTGAKATLMLTEVADTQRFGSVKIDSRGMITAFMEKLGASGPGLINAGIYLLNREVIESIPVGRPVSFERETFPYWVGHGLYGYLSRGELLDIGTPESLASADSFMTCDNALPEQQSAAKDKMQ